MNYLNFLFLIPEVDLRSADVDCDNEQIENYHYYYHQHLDKKRLQRWEMYLTATQNIILMKMVKHKPIQHQRGRVSE